MPATLTVVASPLRAVRRALDRFERALRPEDAVAPGSRGPGDLDDADGPDRDELDATTTRELLVPSPTDEAAATRASRQAQDYLERRRRKLRRELEGR